MSQLYASAYPAYSFAEWLAASEALAEMLSVPVSELPPHPKPSSSKSTIPAPTSPTSATAASKRKATEEDEDVEMSDEKKAKPEVTPEQVQAATATFLSIFEPSSLMMPVLPSREEMASVLLDVRKKALMEEYGVE